LLATHGLAFSPVGHDPRLGPRKVPGGAAGTAARQFAALREAAADCDVIVGCAAMQIAGRSIAESLGMPYFYATYAPVALPSAHHPPPPVSGPPRPEGAGNVRLWELNARWWNDTWCDGLNAVRARIGLKPVDDVRGHVITDRPLLAADPTLAPWPSPSELAVAQTGAWLMPDRRRLSTQVAAFLDAGEPPILFGFGSMLAPRASGSTVLAAARAVGYRAIVMRGWGDLAPPEDSPDWLSVGETNLQAILGRVAAIVHHGGSGTTTQAMLAGTPQVVVPHNYDQPYHAQRVATLGIGSVHPESEPTANSLAERLHEILTPTVRTRAESLKSVVRTDGTAVAAREILGS
jgi:vancomycin aglycone glucosyltransferase